MRRLWDAKVRIFYTPVADQKKPVCLPRQQLHHQATNLLLNRFFSLTNYGHNESKYSELSGQSRTTIFLKNLFLKRNQALKRSRKAHRPDIRYGQSFHERTEEINYMVLETARSRCGTRSIYFLRERDDHINCKLAD